MSVNTAPHPKLSIPDIHHSPIKRLVQEAKDNKVVVDATYGRRTRAVLIMDSGHIILSAVQPETVAGRIDKDISTATTIVENTEEEKENKN